MPLDFGALGFVDQIVAGVSNAMTGGTIEDPAYSQRTTPIGAGPAWLGADVAPRQRLVRPPVVGFVPGDERADRVAVGQGIDPRGTDWLQIAKSQLGVPYVWGANTSGAGFDCSGFSQWLYKRAFGVTLPHQSTAQANALQQVGRDELQPGDLVFFSYGRLGPGVVDHVEVYMGNDKMIGTANPNEDLDIDNVDWSHFVQGGRAPGGTNVPTRPGRRRKTKEIAPGTTMPLMFPLQEYADYISTGTGALDAMPDLPSSLRTVLATQPRKYSPETSNFTGAHKATEQQLYQGFVDAGRQDLADLVGTKDFTTWLNAESGWNVSSVSQYYAGHGRNYGLFQFAQIHPWTEKYLEDGQWTADAYTQAKLVARYFNLTAADVHTYADQIRSGSYAGWS
jgi:cell wall-associated NlpC family hydrolase